MNRGEVVFFHADIVHSGALWRFAGENRRMHTYFGHISQEIDVSSTVVVPEWQCILEDDDDFFKVYEIPKRDPKKGNVLGLIDP